MRYLVVAWILQSSARCNATFGLGKLGAATVDLQKLDLTAHSHLRRDAMDLKGAVALVTAGNGGLGQQAGERSGPGSHGGGCPGCRRIGRALARPVGSSGLRRRPQALPLTAPIK